MLKCRFYFLLGEFTLKPKMLASSLSDLVIQWYLVNTHCNKNGAERLLWSNTGLNIGCCCMISSAWAGNHPTSAKDRGEKRRRRRKREHSQMAWQWFAFITSVRASRRSSAEFLCEIWLLYNLSVIISVQCVMLRPQRNVTERGVLFNEKKKKRHPGVY